MPERVGLKTKRLMLRPFRSGDAADVFEYADDPEWGRFLQLPSPYTYRDAEAFVAELARNSWDTHPSFALTLCDRVIGSIDIRLNRRHPAAEIGYSIARSHWGLGMMPEAAEAVLDWCFRQFEIARIYGRADLDNRQSWRVMEKLRMRREDVQRGSGPSARDASVRVDIVVYSILREEWERVNDHVKAGYEVVEESQCGTTSVEQGKV